MQIEDFVTHLKGVKKAGAGYAALCPGHDDTEQSLSINPGNDGRILLNCFVGCSTKDIVSALNLKMADLFPQKETVSFTPSKKLTVATLATDKGFTPEFLNSLGVVQKKNYVRISYYLEDGSLAARQRVRVALRAKDGSRWEKGEGSPDIYGLWKLNEARKLGFVVFVEGESDCWTLWFHGFPTMGIPGADMTKKLKFEHIKGISKIYVMREPDRGGDTFVAGLTQQLAGWKSWTGEVFEVRLSELTGSKDPNDLHKKDSDKFKDVFQKALETATPLDLPRQEVKAEKTEDAETIAQFTDLENAQRLVERHGKNIRFCHQWGKWLIWEGMRWSKDETGGIVRLAKDTVKTICAEVAGDPKTLKHATRCKNRSRIEAMIKLTESESGIYVTPQQLDSDPMLLNVRNGTIDLRTGELRPHNKADLITKIAPVEYDQCATAPVWDSYLYRIMNGNMSLINFLQRGMGYSITADVSEQVIFIPHGGGDNGKSVFLNTALGIMGDYARPTAPDLLMVKRGESHPTEVADLEGARLVTSIETEENKRLAEATVKQLTGGDRLKARFMRQDFFEFNPTHKIWLATNHKPVVKGSDYAIWKRIRLIPFSVTIPREERDKKLPMKLEAEYPGILRWVVEGCLAWQQEGLGEPEEVTKATTSYRAEMDVLANFINECCFVNPLVKVLVSNLYSTYLNWCKETGEYPLSQRVLSTRLTERGFEGIKGSKGQRFWKGIGLPARVAQVAQGGASFGLSARNEKTSLIRKENEISGDMGKSTPPNATCATPESYDAEPYTGEKRW